MGAHKMPVLIRAVLSILERSIKARVRRAAYYKLPHLFSLTAEGEYSGRIRQYRPSGHEQVRPAAPSSDTCVRLNGALPGCGMMGFLILGCHPYSDIESSSIPLLLSHSRALRQLCTARWPANTFAFVPHCIDTAESAYCCVQLPSHHYLSFLCAQRKGETSPSGP